MFRFELDSDEAPVGSILRLEHFRRLKISLNSSGSDLPLDSDDWSSLKFLPIQLECAWMPRAARRPTYSVNSVNLVILRLGLLSSRSLIMPLGSESTFSSDTSWKWQHGQWPRIWAGAEEEPSEAQELFDLFQDIILFHRQQHLDSCRRTMSYVRRTTGDDIV